MDRSPDGVRIRVQGQVQGVGFRPFVWALARDMGLHGRVLNDASGVLVELAAPSDAFLARLRAEAPPLARIDTIEVSAAPVDLPASGFGIAPSEGGAVDTRVTPDAATCPACAAEVMAEVMGEVMGEADRRAGYAFANCTHCGPRFSILRALPYDRATTSMADFEMCADCRAEYDDPADRRFHAQPVACAACGPRVWLEARGHEAPGPALEGAAALLRAGRILAIKGLGGFHLACDATDPTAIATLRARKRRPGKPFALMAPLEVVRRHAEVGTDAMRLLSDPAAPVVLLRVACERLPEALAPGLDSLGWMLPYTPLHHLLLAHIGRPLVMTSGNLSGEPQVIDNDAARAKLTPFADAFLMHDREIVRRLDDGVERLTAQGPLVLRRARGRAPEPLALPDGFDGAPDGMAWGGQLKGAFCLTKGGSALLSHHIGDLDDALTWDDFISSTKDYAKLFAHRPSWHACDLHPGYRPTQAARARAEAEGLPLIEVQHHHAHLGSAMAENGHPRDGGKVAGIVLDGLGLGSDGTIWGGEVLVGDYDGFDRRAWLQPAPLLGGDAASAEPWRNLLARLDLAGLEAEADALLSTQPRAMLRRAAQAGINAPLSSSAGRLFDAMAAAIGCTPERQSYEGEAAMRLEALARRAPLTVGAYTFAQDAGGAMDTTPLWAAICADLRECVAPQTMAMRFHRGVAEALAAQARAALSAGEAVAVALSGGCFQNVLLLDLTVRALGDVPIYLHRRVPAGDGGLALGQAAIAAALSLGRREEATPPDKLKR